jgi:RimJ/RimL family protein N-acetyltransferase
MGSWRGVLGLIINHPEFQMQIDFEELVTKLQLVHTERLALRPLVFADAWPLWEATRNPAFNAGLLWAQPDHEMQVFERVDAIIQAAQRGRLAAVSAVCKQTGQWVGLFRYLPHASSSSAVEMGIWVHPAYWHGRVAFELAKACGNAIFTFSDVQVLVGAAAPSNRGACTLNRMGGLLPARTVWRKHETLPDVELIEHEITREQWLAQQAEQGAGKRKAFEQVVLPSRSGAAAPAVVQRQTRVTPLLPPQPVPVVEHLPPANETAVTVPLRQAA